MGAGQNGLDIHEAPDNLFRILSEDRGTAGDERNDFISMGKVDMAQMTRAPAAR